MPAAGGGTLADVVHKVSYVTVWRRAGKSGRRGLQRVLRGRETIRRRAAGIARWGPKARVEIECGAILD